MGTITEIVKETTRPCWVHGRRGIFHRWTDSARPAKARGEENDPDAKFYQLYSVHALVEYEDGTVARVWPADLQFADGGEFAAYDWESMEEKRDALPFIVDDLALCPPDKIPKPLRSCMNCGASPAKTDCGYKCIGCNSADCRCRFCEDESEWTPQEG